MALQGTIDAFPLTDVLHLLSTSARSGRFVLEGDRGAAALSIEGGAVVGGAPTSAPGAAPVTAASLVFDMLRFSAGAFVFDVVPAEPGDVPVDPVPLAECLETARAMVEEWAAVEAVVPSTSHLVALNPTLSEGPVTLDEHTWQVVVSAGGRPTVATLLDEVGMDELQGCTTIAELVDRGLLQVSAPAELPSSPDPSPSPSGPTPSAPATQEPSVLDEFPDHFPIDDLIGSGDGDASGWPERALPSEVPDAADASWDALIDEALDDLDTSPARFGQDPRVEDSAPADRELFLEEQVQAAVPVGEPEDQLGQPDAAPQDSTDEVLRQMARLSPKAAEAIAAALHTAAEPDGAAHGDGPDHDASFLGSR